MKLALILNVIDPKIGGVMIMGDRGTGKSTTIRALADLLPEMKVRPLKPGHGSLELNVCRDLVPTNHVSPFSGWAGSACGSFQDGVWKVYVASTRFEGPTVHASVRGNPMPLRICYLHLYALTLEALPCMP